jgi:succinyl-CoA synthetase alpha subunit
LRGSCYEQAGAQLGHDTVIGITGDLPEGWRMADVLEALGGDHAEFKRKLEAR